MNNMRKQIKYSQIYADVLETLGGDLASSFFYVPKKVVVRMWVKLPNPMWVGRTDDLEIIYDM